MARSRSRAFDSTEHHPGQGLISVQWGKAVLHGEVPSDQLTRWCCIDRLSWPGLPGTSKPNRQRLIDKTDRAAYVARNSVEWYSTPQNVRLNPALTQETTTCPSGRVRANVFRSPNLESAAHIRFPYCRTVQTCWLFGSTCLALRPSQEARLRRSSKAFLSLHRSR